MKSRLFFTILFTICNLTGYAADKELKNKIDSLNNVSYEKLIDTSIINIQKYLDNLSDAQKINYPLGIADSYANLSMIYYYKGNYDTGVDYFMKAVNQYKAIGENGKAGYLYGLYGYRYRKRDIKKAIEYMQIGIRMAEKAKAEVELRSLYDNYGVVKEDNGEYDSAYYFYNKSLDLKKEANDEVGIPYSLNKIAALMAIQGRFTESKKIFDEAYQRRIKLNDQIGIAENLSFYGTFYELQDDYDNALKYFKEALVVSKKAGYNLLTQEIYESLANNSKAKNDYKNAFAYLKDQMVYNDSIFNKESNANRNQLEVQFETNEKEKKILEQRANIAEQKLDLEQKNRALFGLIFLVLLIGATGYMFFRNQKLQNTQLKRENELKDSLIRIEAENKVQQERLRISRDLHDNIGSQLTFIISSLDNIKFKLSKDNPDAGERIGEINQFTRNTINELRDTIWAMSKENISFADLKIRINDFIKNARLAAPGIHFNLDLSGQIDDNFNFSSFEGINIYRIIQEAVNNAIKHSGADTISVGFGMSGDDFLITVNDNGKGFTEQNAEAGNGMGFMQNRIANLNGKSAIQSSADSGTSLKFSFRSSQIEA